MASERGLLLSLGVAALLASGCAPALTAQGAKVSVYVVKDAAAAGTTPMPEGCRSLGTQPLGTMTEAEIAVQKDPYRLGRNEAGRAGANALLVRSSLLVPRRTFDCPVASPITDCPGNSGAWYTVAYESYVCTPEALQVLNAPAASPHPPARP